MNNGSLLATLNGHEDAVYDLELINEHLLACSSADFNVSIWDLETNTHKFILRGQTKKVYELKLVSQDILASGSYD
jgi:WD40 repeat protein